MKKFPFFLYLLPLYFYIWALHPYLNYVQPGKLLLPFGIALGVSLFLHLLIHKFSKGKHATYIPVFLWYACYLFFGVIKDALPMGSIFTSYKMLLPVLFLFPLLLYMVVRKREIWVSESMLYLNCLMMILSVVALLQLAPNAWKKESLGENRIALQSDLLDAQPSIYLVLFDEYPGQETLMRHFDFDNDCHKEALEKKRFVVLDSLYSNYDQTIYSVNSLLNLQYLDMARYTPVNEYTTYLKNFKSIRENIFTAFLQKEGYAIRNLSLFNLAQDETPYTFSHLPSAEKAMHRSMLAQRMGRDLLWKLYTGPYRMEWLYQQEVMHVFHQNEQILQELKQQAAAVKTQPQFCFAHVLMPHEPFFCDSSGKVYDMEKEAGGGNSKEKFIAYLQYTNRRMIGLADTLLRDDPGAIIVFMSDHGYRDMPEDDAALRCHNFMAIHLPDANYSRVKTLGSNVNVFRVLLNQYFGEHLPILPDSSVSILERENKISTLRPHYRSK